VKLSEKLGVKGFSMTALSEFLKAHDIAELIVDEEDFLMIRHRCLTVSTPELEDEHTHAFILPLGLSDKVIVKTPRIRRVREGALDLT
jgi:hypothetical protein